MMERKLEDGHIGRMLGKERKGKKWKEDLLLT